MLICRHKSTRDHSKSFGRRHISHQRDGIIPQRQALLSWMILSFCLSIGKSLHTSNLKHFWAVHRKPLRTFSQLQSFTSDDNLQMAHEPKKNAEDSPGKRPLVVVIAGPTAVGKSDVASKLCARLPGLLVSADSVQAYKGPQIGANKPTAEERIQTPHLLVDVAGHNETYNAAEWEADAASAIQCLTFHQPPLRSNGVDTDSETEGAQTDDNDIHKALQRKEIIQNMVNVARQQKNHSLDQPLVPVVCGGTMMYLQWLVHGRPDAMRPTPEALEEASQIITKYQETNDFPGARTFVGNFGEVFAKRVVKFPGEDWYRLRRTLEVALTVQGQPNAAALIPKLYSGQRQGGLASLGYDVRCFFLCPDDRMKHTGIVDRRCEQMIVRGLLRETANLEVSGELPDMAARAIGYRQTLDYLMAAQSAETTTTTTSEPIVDPKDLDERAKEKEIDVFQAFLNDFSTATRRYAKKQMAWFRKDSDFLFVPVSLDATKADRVEASVESILDLCKLSRSAYEDARQDPEGISQESKRRNEKQGSKMKFYQFHRHILKPGSEEFDAAIMEAIECKAQLRTKRRKVENKPST